MADAERQFGVIKDIFFPDDPSTRYDIYFTDQRVAIICMGPSKRYDEVTAGRSFLFGVAPEAPINASEQRINRQTIEQEINQLSISEKLKLSKKSCYYTYQEIEEIKLISGKKPKFAILSEECITKLVPTPEQFKQLADLLPTIEVLNNKTTIIGNLKLKPSQLTCKSCGTENDADALFCDSCGTKMKVETDSSQRITCRSCGIQNRLQASYCKRCGSAICN
jgi:hypothetical protein